MHWEVIILPDEERGKEGNESKKGYGTAGLEKSMMESTLDAEGTSGAGPGPGAAGEGWATWAPLEVQAHFLHSEWRKQKNIPVAFPGCYCQCVLYMHCGKQH